MGCVERFGGRLKNGSLYVGWVESKSGEAVDQKDMKGKFEKDILAHAGVRLIGKEPIDSSLTYSNGGCTEPELWRDYDPKKKIFHREAELVHDLEPMGVSEADVKEFRNEHGAKCDL